MIYNIAYPIHYSSMYILYIIIICPDVRLSVPTFYLVKCVHKICAHFCPLQILCTKYVHTFVLYRFCVQNMCTLLSPIESVLKICAHFCPLQILCTKYVHTFVLYRICAQNMCTLLSSHTRVGQDGVAEQKVGRRPTFQRVLITIIIIISSHMPNF